MSKAILTLLASFLVVSCSFVYFFKDYDFEIEYKSSQDKDEYKCVFVLCPGVWPCQSNWQEGMYRICWKDDETAVEDILEYVSPTKEN